MGDRRRDSAGRWRWPSSLLLGALGAWGWLGAGLPSEDLSWIRVNTHHFMIYSSAGELETLRIAQAFERFRGVLGQLLPRSPSTGGTPTHVFVFGDEATFRPYNLRGRDDRRDRPARFAGFCSSSPFANYIAVDASPESRYERIVYHEYVHLFLSNVDTALPLWLHEGLAEYLSTIELGQDEIALGQPVEHHLEWLERSRWLPLRDVLDMPVHSPAYNETNRAGAFYAQAWLLVHYLLHDAESGPWTARRLLELGASGPAYNEALLTALETDLGQLEQRLRRHAAAEERPEIEIALDVEAFETPSRVRKINQAYMLYRLGELLAFVHDDYAAALEHLEAAIALEPAQPGPHATLAYLLQLEGRDEAAALSFRRATRALDDNPRFYLLYGQGCLQRFESQAGKVFELGRRAHPLVLKAREQFRRSVELAPTLAEGHVGLGTTYLYDPGDPAPGIEALEQARRLLPARPDIAANLAVLYAQAGRAEDSRRLMQKLEQTARDPSLIAQTRQTVLLARQSAVHSLVRQGRLSEAQALLEAMIAEVTDADLRSSLKDNLAAVRAGAEKQSRIDRYNQALELIDQQKLREASALLAQLEPDVTDPELALRVRVALEQLRDAATR